MASSHTSFALSTCARESAVSFGTMPVRNRSGEDDTGSDCTLTLLADEVCGAFSMLASNNL